MKRMIFRADANKTIGRGHLSRLSAIAKMLEDQFLIFFVVAKENKDFCIPLLSNEWNILGIESNIEFQFFLNSSDYLWVDGYHFDDEWRSIFKPVVHKLIYVNDIPSVINFADAILNHTPSISRESFPTSEIEYYLGLDYAMLRSSFLEAAKSRVQVELKGEGIFVCFGGADPDDIGQKVVEGLVENGFTKPIYLVTGKEYSTLKEFENVSLLSNLSEQQMIAYIDLSRVCIVPSSVLSFELIALRKPFVTCYFVDNQELIYKGLSELELAKGVGFVNGNPSSIEQIVNISLKFYEETQLHLDIISRQISAITGNSKQYIQQILN